MSLLSDRLLRLAGHSPSLEKLHQLLHSEPHLSDNTTRTQLGQLVNATAAQRKLAKFRRQLELFEGLAYSTLAFLEHVGEIRELGYGFVVRSEKLPDALTVYFAYQDLDVGLYVTSKDKPAWATWSQLKPFGSCVSVGHNTGVPLDQFVRSPQVQDVKDALWALDLPIPNSPRELLDGLKHALPKVQAFAETFDDYLGEFSE